MPFKNCFVFFWQIDFSYLKKTSLVIPRQQDKQKAVPSFHLLPEAEKCQLKENR